MEISHKRDINGTQTGQIKRRSKIMLGGNGDDYKVDKFKGYISHRVLDQKKKEFEEPFDLKEKLDRKLDNLNGERITKSTKLH